MEFNVTWKIKLLQLNFYMYFYSNRLRLWVIILFINNLEYLKSTSVMTKITEDNLKSHFDLNNSEIQGLVCKNTAVVLFNFI